MKDYLPLKVIVEDLCVSRTTLWRAVNSNIAGFPAPTRVGRQVYWKKSEIDRLEDALMRFQGRCAFDRHRAHSKKLSALKRGKTPATRKRPAPARSHQQDLFSS